MYHFTALVTCLAILAYFFTAVQVTRARAAFGIKAPAIIGNPDFERVFRVQANTLEWMPIFLPSLWLFAIYVGDPIAAVLGLVWIAGRILYMTGYSQAANKRGPGFGIQASAAILLWAGALAAIVWRLLHGVRLTRHCEERSVLATMRSDNEPYYKEVLQQYPIPGVN